MVLTVEIKCVLVGKTSDCFGIVRRRDELTARLESSAESQHKVPNLRQCQIIVRFIPEAQHWVQSVIRGEYQGTNHETLFAIGQIRKRKFQASLFVGKLNFEAPRIGADHWILDV